MWNVLAPVLVFPGGNYAYIFVGNVSTPVLIYCDFSGYTDIAIGAATILGFNIPANFNKPYFATSPVDFWRRWHISLSTWLRDYLYIPLGGNRKGNLRTYSNLITVMLLGGLWHGASWNFVIWGLMHGAFLAIQKIILNSFPSLKNNSFLHSRSGKIITIIGTQYLIFMTWLAFRVEDFETLSYVLYKYVVWDFMIDSTLLGVISHNKIPIILIIGFFLLHYISYKRNLVKLLSELKSVYWIGFLIIVMTAVFFFYDTMPEQFIYFRF